MDHLFLLYCCVAIDIRSGSATRRPCTVVRGVLSLAIEGNRGRAPRRIFNRYRGGTWSVFWLALVRNLIWARGGTWSGNQGGTWSRIVEELDLASLRKLGLASVRTCVLTYTHVQQIPVSSQRNDDSPHLLHTHLYTAAIYLVADMTSWHREEKTLRQESWCANVFSTPDLLPL